MENVTEDTLAEFNNPLPLEDSTVLWNITRWSRFVAIAGFLLVAFLSLCVFAAYMQSGTVRYRLQGNNGATLLILVSGALVTIVMMVFLLRFAILTRRGILTIDQGLFNEGINALKNYFIINGIAGVIYCLLTLIGLFARLR